MGYTLIFRGNRPLAKSFGCNPTLAEGQPVRHRQCIGPASVTAAWTLCGKRLDALSLAFKDDTDDFREYSTIHVIGKLLGAAIQGQGRAAQVVEFFRSKITACV
jgi:hypothetical protein